MSPSPGDGRFDLDISEVKYLRHGGAAYLARIMKPRGPGPFPAVLERFVSAYRKAGGHIEIELFEGPDYDDIRTHPESRSALETFQKIVAFIHRETGTNTP